MNNKTNQKQIEQCILKWSVNVWGVVYWYVIRKDKENGFWIEGYYNDQTGRTAKPSFRLPLTTEDVRKEFANQGKIFNN